MSSAVALNLEWPYITAAEALRANPGQWQAYESKGNCVVLAGPGSGKTKTLTIKMARMLAEDVQSPRGIACITFNTECAGELRRRLEQLGIQEGRNVFVGTIHSFCLKHVVLPYARLAGLNLPDDVAVALPSEQQRTFEKAFAKVVSPDTPPDNWRTGFDKYRRTHLDRDVPEWRGDDNQSATLIEEYEASLRRKGLIDFDDMMLIGLRLIESHEWVRQCLRARFPILVVDEYQDLGLPLHRIVMALCFKSGMRLLAVGDPDQSIYGFAGANPALLQELAEHKGVEKVHLRFNYRSGQKIIDASEVALGERRDYQSKGGYAGTINFYRSPQGLDQQAAFTCEKIILAALERHEGRNLGDIAVLYIDKNDGDVIERAVRKAGMKFIRMDRGGPYAKTPLTRWLEDCGAWCAGGWKTGKPRLSTLARAWEGFNASVKTESALYSLKLALVKFLFSHRTPQGPLRNWLADIQESLRARTQAIAKNLTDFLKKTDSKSTQRTCGKRSTIAAPRS